MRDKNPVEVAIDRYHSSMIDRINAQVLRAEAGKDLDAAKAKYEAAMDRCAAMQDAADAAREAMTDCIAKALKESIAQ